MIFIAISGESEDNGGATSAAYANFSGSRFPRPMVSPRFRDKAVSSNTGPVEKVLSLLSMQFLHKATRADTDNLQQQQLQQQDMMNMMMMSIMASSLNCGVSQTTTSTDRADPIQAMMNSIIALNMISMQQTMQSQNLTSTAGANAQQTLSASTQCQTLKNNSGSSSSDDE
jgi:hypothetical protein